MSRYSTSSSPSPQPSSLPFNRSTSSEESESLLPSLLPPPSHPRARQRTLATTILILFFTILLYLALFAPTEIEDDQIRGVGWMRYQNVIWGQSSNSKSSSASEMSQGGKSEAGMKELGHATTPPYTEDASEEGKVGLFGEEKGRNVELMREQGLLSDYVWHARLDRQEWNTTIALSGGDQEGRLIVVGDLHGSLTSLLTLLDSLSYNETTDILLHVGDLVSKAPLRNSLATVKWMRERDIRGVRGNHDQGVIEWRRWMEAYGALESGATEILANDDEMVGMRKRKRRGWFGFGSGSSKEEEASTTAGEQTDPLEQEEVSSSTSRVEGTNQNSTSNKTWSISDIDSRPPHARPTKQHASTSGSPAFGESSTDSSSSYFSSGTLLTSSYSWLSLSEFEVQELGVVIPKDWEWGGEWFEIARHLPQADFDYLVQLPLTLYLEELESYVVHAGLVPAETATSPLSTYVPSPKTNTSLLTSLSSLSFTPPPRTSAADLLTIEQNTLPFTLLNLRTLGLPKKPNKPYKVSKGKKGTAWSEVWANVMNQCVEGEGSCRPVSIVYGHWAGRGLDVKDWSIGLDSGCVYGRRLSALVWPLRGGTSSEVEGKKKGKGKWRVLEPEFNSGIDVKGSRRRKIIMAPRAPPPPRPRPRPAGIVATGATKLLASSDDDDDDRRVTLPKPKLSEAISLNEGTDEATADDPDATSSSISDEEEAGQLVEEDVTVFGGRRAKIVSVACGALVERM